MTRELALQELRSDWEAYDTDIEPAHERADGILCDLLNALGYGDVVAAYHQVPKNY